MGRDPLERAPEPRLPEPWITLAIRVNGGKKYGCVTRLANVLGALQCTLRKWAHSKITPHQPMREVIFALFDAHGVERPTFGSTCMTGEALKAKRKDSREVYQMSIRLGLCPKCSSPKGRGVYCDACAAKDLARKGVQVSREASVALVRSALRPGESITLSDLAKVMYPGKVFKTPQGAARAVSLHRRYLVDQGILVEPEPGRLALGDTAA